MAKIKALVNGTKKDAIIKKAATLFRLKGYEASSMRELAEKIGVEAPSLYNHIGSKSELLQIICFKVANDFMIQLQEVENTDIPKLRKIELLIRFHIWMMLQSFDEVYVSNHEWKYLKEPQLGLFLNQRRGYEKRFVKLIEEGVKTGELKMADPYVTVLTILSAVRGLEFWQHHKKNITTETLEDTMVTHLLNGIAK